MNEVEYLWPNGAPGWEDVPDNQTVANRDVEQTAQGLSRAISRTSAVSRREACSIRWR